MNTEGKLTVVARACWKSVICHSYCKVGDKMLNMVVSMLSAIQQSPVNSDNFTWNLPNPKASTAWATVYVSVRSRIQKRQICLEAKGFTQPIRRLNLIVYFRFCWRMASSAHAKTVNTVLTIGHDGHVVHFEVLCLFLGGEGIADPAVRFV